MLRLQELDGVEDVLQRAAELAVAAVAERLEIDLVEADVRPDVLQDLVGAVAVADVGADEPGRDGLLEDGDGPLRGDQRLVVGRGQDWSPVLPCKRHEVGG